MNILVVYAHPKEESFTHFIYAHTLKRLQEKGHKVKARNLYKIGFNPVLSSQDLENSALGSTLSEDILKEQTYINWCHMIILIYPIWWWGTPAILKGWIDRVFCKGFAYDHSEKGPLGKLSKKALVIQTVGMPSSYPEILESGHLFKRSVAEGFFSFCGITDCQILSLYGLLWPKMVKVSDHLRDIDTFLSTYVKK